MGWGEGEIWYGAYGAYGAYVFWQCIGIGQCSHEVMVMLMLCSALLVQGLLWCDVLFGVQIQAWVEIEIDRAGFI